MSDIWLPKTIEEDLAQYADAKHERHAHGLILVNGKEVATTLQCPHCGGHFISRKGSGHKRRFCMRHMAPLCDKVECNAACIDFHPEATQAREL